MEPLNPATYIEEIQENTRTITGVSTSITAFVGFAKKGPFNKPVTIHSFEEYEKKFGGLYKSSTISYAVYHYFINGGKDAIIIRAVNTTKNATKQLLGSRVNKTGIYALDKIEIFNILCIPGFTSTGDTPKSVYAAALAYCKKRRAILLIDSPVSWTGFQNAADIDNDPAMPYRSENGAIFFPRILAADPMQDGLIRDFSPSGAVAGVIARTDSKTGVWKAPAGIDASLAGITGLTVNLTDKEQNQLNPKGINCLRVFQTGPVIWGSRTMVGVDGSDSQWKYLPVRRTALFIEESVYGGTQWAVFEPNDEPLWSQIRLSVGAFMQDLFRQGVFQGSTSKEAYFVKCDRETMTQDEINKGKVNILVGFAPLKPAEFVIIRIQQITKKSKRSDRKCRICD